MDTPKPKVQSRKLPRNPLRIRAQPTRTEPNGWCIDCGRQLSRSDAMRCRRHNNLHHHRFVNPKTFTKATAGDAARRKATLERERKAEVVALRAKLAALAEDGERRWREKYHWPPMDVPPTD